MIRRTPRSTRTDTLFPSRTLVRARLLLRRMHRYHRATQFARRLAISVLRAAQFLLIGLPRLPSGTIDPLRHVFRGQLHRRLADDDFQSLLRGPEVFGYFAKALAVIRDVDVEIGRAHV